MVVLRFQIENKRLDVLNDFNDSFSILPSLCWAPLENVMFFSLCRPIFTFSLDSLSELPGRQRASMPGIIIIVAWFLQTGTLTHSQTIQYWSPPQPLELYCYIFSSIATNFRSSCRLYRHNVLRDLYSLLPTSGFRAMKAISDSSVMLEINEQHMYTYAASHKTTTDLIHCSLVRLNMN